MSNLDKVIAAFRSALRERYSQKDFRLHFCAQCGRDTWQKVITDGRIRCDACLTTTYLNRFRGLTPASESAEKPA